MAVDAISCQGIHTSEFLASSTMAQVTMEVVVTVSTAQLVHRRHAGTRLHCCSDSEVFRLCHIHDSFLPDNFRDSVATGDILGAQD